MKAIIIGRSGSGKSSLLKMLENIGKPIIKERAREILEKYSKYSVIHKQVKMMYEQWDREKGKDSFISDRGLHDYIVYSRRNGLHAPFYEERLNHRYNLVFRLPNRPFVQDGTRVEKDDIEAQSIQDEIEKLYMETGHTLIEVPNVDLIQKYRFVLRFLEHTK
jgi:predicted ATPase